MKRSKFLVFAVALFALLFGAKAVSANSLTLDIDDVYTNSTSITGDATKGASIIVRDANKKVLAKSTADSVNGKFQVNLNSKLKAYQKVYVYAREANDSYFYRIMNVKPASSKVTTSHSSSATTSTSNSSSSKTNSSSKKTSSSKSSKVSINTPTGTWKSGNNAGYTVVTKFNQSTGLNQYLYYNGKYTKKLINYATYKVTAKGSFWKITYRQRHHKTYQNMYIRFTSNKTFWIVNSKNKPLKVKFGNAPVHYYKFALQK